MRAFVRHHHRREPGAVWQRLRRAIVLCQRRIAALRSITLRILLGLGACLVVAGFTLLLSSPILMLREIRVQRTDTRIDVEHVQDALSPLFGRRLFLLARQEIGDRLRERIPDVVDVQIFKQYPGTLHVRLTLDPLIARLDIANPEDDRVTAGTGATGNQEYLTARGMVVAYAPSQLQGEMLLPRITVVNWGVRPRPWTALLTPEFLQAMRQAEETIVTQFGQEVIERRVFLRAQEFHLRTKSFALWFDMRSSIADHLQRYRIFLEVVGKDSAKQYVDLRLLDRVVYQ